MTEDDRCVLAIQYILCTSLVAVAAACRIWLDGGALAAATVIGAVIVVTTMLFTANVDATAIWTEPLTIVATFLVLTSPSSTPHSVLDFLSTVWIPVVAALVLLCIWNGILTSFQFEHRHCQLQAAVEALQHVVQGAPAAHTRSEGDVSKCLLLAVVSQVDFQLNFELTA
ncbi:hypothetical protein FB45DRAFT_1039210 [Roridomyces roridus]|uniref:Uncharacterized protein n=1 Tax=Roridomyces roridus TaxID=1738132 RepID=A0AAD7B3P9_9AGAR|nr:hypothetical protein FB45DRAFT_1039210 [Roridomyces roridus]